MEKHDGLIEHFLRELEEHNIKVGAPLHSTHVAVN